MNRSDMVCSRCMKFDGANCRCRPTPISVPDPLGHWCAQGLWQEWSDQYEEMEPMYWGEWNDDA
jgi:hypothetical protein